MEMRACKNQNIFSYFFLSFHKSIGIRLKSCICFYENPNSRLWKYDLSREFTQLVFSYIRKLSWNSTILANLICCSIEGKIELPIESKKKVKNPFSQKISSDSVYNRAWYDMDWLTSSSWDCAHSKSQFPCAKSTKEISQKKLPNPASAELSWWREQWWGRTLERSDFRGYEK